MDYVVKFVSRNVSNMFFKTSRFGCRKMICDVMKVTSNMYLCDMSCMSREMTKTDGRDSVKCRKSKRRDIMGIITFV